MKRMNGIMMIVMAVMMSFTVSAQSTESNDLRCLNQLSDLSSDQKEKITELVGGHQSIMSELRNQRRSTTDYATKAKIREQMDLQKANHRSEVLEVLNKDQQVQYLALTSSGQGKYKKGNSYNNNGGKGKGKGQGQGQGKRGKGNCQGGKGKYGSRGNS